MSDSTSSISENERTLNLKKKKSRDESKISLELLKDFEVSRNEERFNEICSALKFLSKIGPDEKINVLENRRQIVKNKYLDRLYRTILREENATTTLAFVKNVINTAITQMYSFLSFHTTFYTQLANIIKKEIIGAKRGIENLAKTYTNENNYQATNFETFITSINVKLQLNHDL